MSFKLHDMVGWLKSIHFIYVVVSKSAIDNGLDTMYTIILSLPTKIFNYQMALLNRH